MTANELRRKYVSYFEERRHKEIASASLIPENDPSVLFTTAGMHPLVPYLLGENHPLGQRLVGIQKCLRTADIEEVGDASHLTFFEMLGNWSLGDYGKEESISMSFEFLANVMKVPVENLAVTVFDGDEMIPRDIESYELWKKSGLEDQQIFFYGREENWWGPAGLTGPCGPDTEIFYNNGAPKCNDHCGPSCHCGKYVEIWNNVFMEYNKNQEGAYTQLAKKNVDTGMGLERMLTVFNGFDDVYQTELFHPIMKRLEDLIGVRYGKENERTFRIICEHMRAVTFLLGDNKAVAPSNSEQGYILRRLLRRVIRLAKSLGRNDNILCELSELIITMYGDVAPELVKHKIFILEQLDKEYQLFSKTLDHGLKIAEKYFSAITEEKVLSAELAFRLYDTFGFPIEFTQELAEEKGCTVDIDGFWQKYKEHQEKSRAGAEDRFKGGLADNSEQVTKLHTATHLLNGALRTVLGEEVYQKGSNITSERLRFDFSFERKLTLEELTQVSQIVKEAIEREIEVECTEMTVEEAKASGAIGVFDTKYGEQVKVYTIDGYSKEICGGPHTKNTKDLKSFSILKEESSSAGVRRIKATIG